MPPIRELFRLGYKPNPWALPDWKYRPFSGRYADPRDEYRILYAAGLRRTAFVEALQNLVTIFRPDPELVAALAEIEGPDDLPATSQLPRRILEQHLQIRQMGSGGFDVGHDMFAEICSSDWIMRLRHVVLPHLHGLGLKSFDLSSLLLSTPRRLTQLASRAVYESGIRIIHYPSKFGLELENWAFLDFVPITDQAVQDVQTDDPDLHLALHLHGFELGA